LRSRASQAQQAREERQRLGAELDAERKRAALAETSLASALRGGGGAAPTGDLSSDASQVSPSFCVLVLD